MEWPTNQEELDKLLLEHEGKVPRFFIDDESGEPWQLFGDVGSLSVAYENGKTYVQCAIDHLLGAFGKDGDEVTLTIRRQDMTDEEVDELPDI